MYRLHGGAAVHEKTCRMMSSNAGAGISCADMRRGLVHSLRLSRGYSFRVMDAGSGGRRVIASDSRLQTLVRIEGLRKTSIPAARI